MIRTPVVAGQFYPSSPKTLEREVGGYLAKADRKEDAIGVISPHAGYIYSGPVAGKVLGGIKTKPAYVIIGPNHTGMGAPFSMDTEEAWQTPLGEVRIDSGLAEEILKRTTHIEKDRDAHSCEHSIEVQLPFLQVAHAGKDFVFVPIIVSHARLGVYKEIGRGIASAISESGKRGSVTLIASSDMTHYEGHDTAKEKDSIAIRSILNLNEDELDRVVREFDISMCGYAPTCIMLACAKMLGAKTARLVEYRTSGDVTGDYTSVVGYAGMVVA